GSGNVCVGGSLSTIARTAVLEYCVTIVLAGKIRVSLNQRGESSIPQCLSDLLNIPLVLNLLDLRLAARVEVEARLPYLTVLQVDSELYLRYEKIGIQILPVEAPVIRPTS